MEKFKEIVMIISNLLSNSFLYVLNIKIQKTIIGGFHGLVSFILDNSVKLFLIYESSFRIFLSSLTSNTWY